MLYEVITDADVLVMPGDPLVAGHPVPLDPPLLVPRHVMSGDPDLRGRRRRRGGRGDHRRLGGVSDSYNFV